MQTSHTCIIHPVHSRETHIVRSAGNGGQGAFPACDMMSWDRVFLREVLLSLPPIPIIPTVQPFPFSIYSISYLAALLCVLCP